MERHQHALLRNPRKEALRRRTKLETRLAEIKAEQHAQLRSIANGINPVLVKKVVAGLFTGRPTTVSHLRLSDFSSISRRASRGSPDCGEPRSGLQNRWGDESSPAGSILVRLRKGTSIRTPGATKQGWMHVRDSTTNLVNDPVQEVPWHPLS